LNEDGFRSWMQAQGQAPNTVSTRLADARRVEKHYGDLDAAFEHDGFAAILADLAYNAADNAAGKPNNSRIQVDGDPYKSLASYRSAISVYRQFLEGHASESADQSQADKIRAFVATEYAEPARREERRSFNVRSGDVHRQMGLSNAMPAVCSAIGSSKFEAFAHVKLSKREGPANSSTVEFTFDFTNLRVFDVKRTEEILRQRYGSSDVDNQKMVSFTLRDERTIALQRDIARVQLWLEDDDRPDPPPVQELQHYPAERGRHADLPSRLRHTPRAEHRTQGFPMPVLSARVSDESELLRLLDWYERKTRSGSELNDDGSHGVQVDGMTKVKPTNLILYGPPGTGKTFATAEEAVRLCDGVAPSDRAELKMRYDALMESGQIGFVTFHQSYAYEDFVEGLRPTTESVDPEQDGVASGFRLEPRKGVFREISALAEQARKSSARGGGYDLDGRGFFKMSLGRAGLEDHIFDAAIEGGYIALGYGGDVDWADPQYDDYQAVFNKWNEIEPGTSGNSGNISQVWRFRGSMREGDIVIVSDGNSQFRAIGEITGPYRFEPTGVRNYSHRRSVRWLLVLDDESLPVDTIHDGPFTMMSCYRLKDAKVKKEALSRLLPSSTPAVAAAPDQFVLIIDEINRANISKVFGELITLIEPDKRLGQSNELRLKLPYSGDTFGVPDNLHIVGTMNTADRSIALLDTALRRRFQFKELMPNESLLSVDVGGINLQALLTALNHRIEYLFDREHQIGHAYFFGLDTRGDVDEVIRTKIIPLLSEYFYEDWSKVRQVLGDTSDEGGFVIRTRLSPPSGGQGDYGFERWRYSVRETFDLAAYRQLTG
jgi:5-methylcytosine-specific restriction enzyme B